MTDFTAFIEGELTSAQNEINRLYQKKSRGELKAQAEASRKSKIEKATAESEKLVKRETAKALALKQRRLQASPFFRLLTLALDNLTLSAGSRLAYNIICPEEGDINYGNPDIFRGWSS